MVQDGSLTGKPHGLSIFHEAFLYVFPYENDEIRLRALARMEGPCLVAAARLEEGIPKLPLGEFGDVFVNICGGSCRIISHHVIHT